VLRVEELCGVPVSVIGVGPRRDQTIVRRDLLGGTGGPDGPG
jgi:adenylosuccinate synthase